MKIVVLELGFEDDDDADDFYAAVREKCVNELTSRQAKSYDVIECRVENP